MNRLAWVTACAAVLVSCSSQGGATSTPVTCPVASQVAGTCAVSGTVDVGTVAQPVAVSSVAAPVAISGIASPVQVEGSCAVTGTVDVGSVAQPIAISGIATPVQLAGPLAVTLPPRMRIVTADSDADQLLTGQVQGTLVDASTGCGIAVDGPFVLTDLHSYEPYVSSPSPYGTTPPTQGRVIAQAAADVAASPRWQIEIRAVDGTVQTALVSSSTGAAVGRARALTGARLAVRAGEKLVICLGRDQYGHFSNPATWSGFKPY